MNAALDTQYYEGEKVVGEAAVHEPQQLVSYVSSWPAMSSLLRFASISSSMYFILTPRQTKANKTTWENSHTINRLRSETQTA